jgi:chemotaxis signal transduction protein
MPVPSSLKPAQGYSFRRGDRSTPETAQQYVLFNLQVAWFALPVTALYRVLPLDSTLPQITYGGKTVPILDANSLFQNFPKSRTSPTNPCLIIVGSESSQLVALQSDSQPILQRLASHLFQPLPPRFAQKLGVSFVTKMMPAQENKSAVFAIAPDLLLQSVSQNHFLH